MFSEKNVAMRGHSAKCLLLLSILLEGLTAGPPSTGQMEANQSAQEELISLCGTDLGAHTF